MSDFQRIGEMLRAPRLKAGALMPMVREIELRAPAGVRLVSGRATMLPAQAA